MIPHRPRRTQAALGIAGDIKVRVPDGNAGEQQKTSISSQRLQTRVGQEAASTQLTWLTGVMIP